MNEPGNRVLARIAVFSYVSAYLDEGRVAFCSINAMFSHAHRSHCVRSAMFSYDHRSRGVRNAVFHMRSTAGGGQLPQWFGGVVPYIVGMFVCHSRQQLESFHVL